MLNPPCPTEIPAPINVMGLPIRPLRTDALIELLVRRGQAGLRTTACYANAHTVNLALRDKAFRRLLCDASVLYADGGSVVWASRWSSVRLTERMTADDFFPRLASRCAAANLSLYLLGGRAGIADGAAERMQAETPGLQVVGTHHGYFEASDSEQIVQKINARGPDVLIVGMSSPRQECWLSQQGRGLQTPVRWCVGALLDYYAGVERRAPRWLRRVGCEWLFRLAVDPAGKWRRYLLGNPWFVLSALAWARLQRTTGTSSVAVSAAEG